MNLLFLDMGPLKIYHFHWCANNQAILISGLKLAISLLNITRKGLRFQFEMIDFYFEVIVVSIIKQSR